jgi:hypothetical protein
LSDLDKTLGRTGQSNQSPPGSDVIESDTVGQLRKSGDFRNVAIPPGMEPTRKEIQQEAFAKPFRISPPFEVAPAGGSGSQFIALAGEGNGRYQAPLDFEAHSLLVDNWSAQYLYFPTANKWVSPFQIDKVISVPRGCTTLDLKFITPLPGTITLPAVVANQFVSVQAYEGWMAPGGGTDISQAAVGIDTDTNIDQIGGSTLTGANAVDSAGVPLVRLSNSAGAGGIVAIVPGDGITANVALYVAAALEVFNGATMDRLRSISGVGDGFGVALASQPSSTPLAASATNAVATVTMAAVAGQQHRVTFLDLAYAGGIPAAVTLATLSDGTTTWTFPQAAANAAQNETALPPGGVKFAVNTNTVVTLPASGTAGTIGYINVAKLTA